MSGIPQTAVSVAILTTIVGLVFSSIAATRTENTNCQNKNHMMEIRLFVSSFIAVFIHVYVVHGPGGLG